MLRNMSRDVMAAGLDVNISIGFGDIAFKFVVPSPSIEMNAIPNHAVDETFTTPEHMPFLVVLYVTSITDATRTALLIIDVQNCFLPGGSLAVPGGKNVIPVINKIRADYADGIALTVLTQDWHCSDHVSFAAEHPGKNASEVILLQYDESGSICTNASCNVAYNVTQMLWPVHCVINTTSAEFSTSLTRKEGDVVVRKGYNCEVDSYSGFFDNGGFKQTEMDTVLKAHNIQRVITTGLAFDYCVYYTSKDAVKLGYETYVVEDASQPIADSSAQKAREDMKNNDIKIIQSKDLGTLFQTASADKRVPLLYFVFISILCFFL